MDRNPVTAGQTAPPRTDERTRQLQWHRGPSFPSQAISTPLACLAVCVAYSVTGAAGVWLLQRVLTPDFAGVAATLGVPWLAAGLGVGGLILFGTRAWPGVFAGSCITWGIVQGDAWVTVLLGSVSESVSIVLIAWLLRLWGYRLSLERYQDALILIGAAAIGRVLTATTDVIGLVAVVWVHAGSKSPLILDEAGIHRTGDVIVLTPALFTYALRWWANTVAGIVLVVPLLAFVTHPLARQRSGTIREPALWTLAALAWLATALSLSGGSLRLAFLASALVLVAWAALRLGVAVASVGTLLFSMATTVGFGLQLGVFAGTAGRESIQIQWSFIGLLIGVGLFLTALLSGRERTRQQLEAAAERYRRLYQANPSPIWAEEIATGRILVVNDAALRAYGYAEEEFLRLRRQDLDAGASDTATDAKSDEVASVRSVAATHRTASGTTIEVELSSVPMELDGVPVRKCFVDIVDERNDLRLAVLNAADLERQRLGKEIREHLGGVLAHLDSSVRELLQTSERGEPIEQNRMLPLEQDAAAATTLCRQLTRGASPIEFARGDLLEAVRGLPDVLTVAGGPALEVSVRSFAPVSLSLERSEHLYRIAQDAARAALVRPGVRRVHVTVDVTADTLEISVEDDGEVTTAGQPPVDSEASPIAIRAAAAHARLRVEPCRAGGTRVRFECGQGLSAAQPADSAPAGDPEPVDVADAAATAALAEQDYLSATGGRHWIPGLSLFIAYVVTSAAGLVLLRHMDPERVTFLPRLAFPWVANGVAVVGLLLGGERLAPFVLLGSVAVWGGLVHDPWITVLPDAIGEMLCAILVVRLLTRWGFRRTVDRARDLGFLFVAAAAGRTLPMAIDIVGLHVATALAPGSLTPELRGGLATATEDIWAMRWPEVVAFLRWWLNGVAGIALFVPTVVALSAGVRRMLRERWPETLLFVVALGVAAAAIAAGPQSDWRLPLLALGVVLVGWAGARFGVALASTATLVLSLGATAGYSLGLGPFAATSPAEGSEVVWGFVGLLAATGLFLTTAVVNYDRTASSLQKLKARYEGLFEAIPRPVFGYDGATGRINAVNAEAIRTYGYTRAEFLGMRPADLAADPLMMSTAAAPLSPTVRPTAHRTHSGRVIEVELAETPIDIDGKTEILCFAADVTERNDLRRRVLEAADRERRHLAQDLHDGLGQTLTGLSLGLASLRRDINSRSESTVRALSFISRVARQARGDCEHILNGLSPLEATGGDLLEALRNLPAQLPPESRQQLTVAIEAPVALRLSVAKREHLYQIARESVNNALKHAKASRIAVTLIVSSVTITLLIADNGTGFDPKVDRSTGLGLRSLGLRADALRGRLSIERGKHGGTIVTCRCAPATG